MSVVRISDCGPGEVGQVRAKARPLHPRRSPGNRDWRLTLGRAYRIWLRRKANEPHTSVGSGLAAYAFLLSNQGRLLRGVNGRHISLLYIHLAVTKTPKWDPKPSGKVNSMPDANQYVFNHKQLLEALVKEAGVHEGKWALHANFGCIQGRFGPSVDR